MNNPSPIPFSDFATNFENNLGISSGSIPRSGAAQIVDGIHKESKWSKRFTIGVGAQTIGTSVFILSIPTLGVAWAGQSAAITLLAGGTQSLVSALGIGKRIRIKR